MLVRDLGLLAHDPVDPTMAAAAMEEAGRAALAEPLGGAFAIMALLDALGGSTAEALCDAISCG